MQKEMALGLTSVLPTVARPVSKKTARMKVSSRAMSLKTRSWRRRRHLHLARLGRVAAATSVASQLPPAPTSSNPHSQMNDGPKKALKVSNYWPGDRPEKPQCAKEFWLEDIKGPAVLSLVYAWIMQNPDWLAVWVNGYKSMKWDKKANCMVSILVGGHYRRRAHMGKCPLNLALMCKFDRGWARNTYLESPFCAARERWTKDGVLVPREQRSWVWH